MRSQRQLLAELMTWDHMKPEPTDDEQTSYWTGYVNGLRYALGLEMK